MRVGIAQMNLAVGCVDDNVGRMVDIVAAAATRGCDLIEFPEMCDTGYWMPAIGAYASMWSGGPMARLRDVARSEGIAVVAGLSERTPDGIYNSVAAISSQGEIVGRYRKTHLVSVKPIFETRYVRTGGELVATRLGEVMAGFMICYDLRFAEVAQALAIAGCQVIFLPAAFPARHIVHWNVLVRARAIENQVFVLACNRIGSDGPGTRFGGSSQVVDPDGNVLVAAPTDEETLLTCDLDLTSIASARTNVPALSERRPDVYSRPIVPVAVDVTGPLS